jgi:hypothetical protein
MNGQGDIEKSLNDLEVSVRFQSSDECADEEFEVFER